MQAADLRCAASLHGGVHVVAPAAGSGIGLTGRGLCGTTVCALDGCLCGHVVCKGRRNTHVCLPLGLLLLHTLFGKQGMLSWEMLVVSRGVGGLGWQQGCLHGVTCCRAYSLGTLHAGINSYQHNTGSA